MCLSTTRDLSNTKQEFVPLARDVSVGNEMEVSGQMHAPARITPGKAPWYPLNRRLGGGGQSRCGPFGEEKICCPYRDWHHGPSSAQFVAVLTELSRLRRYRWEGNIKVGLKVTGLQWIHLAQDS
jgi:hypothetical protein